MKDSESLLIFRNVLLTEKVIMETSRTQTQWVLQRKGMAEYIPANTQNPPITEATLARVKMLLQLMERQIAHIRAVQMQQMMQRETSGMVHSIQPNMSSDAWDMKSEFLLLKNPRDVAVLGKMQWIRSHMARFRQRNLDTFQQGRRTMASRSSTFTFRTTLKYSCVRNASF